MIPSLSATDFCNDTSHPYASKNPQYFGGVRYDWFAELSPCTSYRILEVGCGNGDNAAYAQSKGFSSFYAGVEIHHSAARNASHSLDDVICGNCETTTLPWPRESFDLLLLSEVLEHLQFPERFLKAVSGYLRHGGVVFASSPNVSHHSVVRMLLCGKWRLSTSGIMDETHLRWFTPHSYKCMFENAGYVVTDLRPVSKLSPKANFVNMITFRVLDHLFWSQINLKAVKP